MHKYLVPKFFAHYFTYKYIQGIVLPQKQQYIFRTWLEKKWLDIEAWTKEDLINECKSESLHNAFSIHSFSHSSLASAWAGL